MIGRRQIRVIEEDGRTEDLQIYLPNIKSVGGFLRGTWNFTVYDDCFDGRSKLGDIDASIELYGHTLLIEFKRERTAITAGQIVKAIRQAKHSNITTIFVFGDTDRPVEYLTFSPNHIEGSGFKSCDTISLSKLFKNWNDYAKRNDLTSRNDTDWNIAKGYLNQVGGGKQS